MGSVARFFRRVAALLRPQRVPFIYDGRYVMDVSAIPHDPRRGQNILTFLATEGLISRGGLRWPREVSWEALRRVHTQEYLEAVLEPGSLLKIVGLSVPDPDQDRFLTLQRAMVGGTLLATRLALAEGRPVVNLGGGLHHAHAGRGQGFCVFNDVAVAIAEQRERGFDEPVLVVDCDLHDGDGTRTIFAADETVHTYSIHNLPWELSPAVASTSITLGDDVEDDLYLETLQGTLPQVIEAVEPGLVYYLAGCDPAADDALGNWRISADGLFARDRFVVESLRQALGEVPLVILLAGGYGSQAWRYSARFFGWLLSGRRIEPPSSDDVVLERLRHLSTFLSPLDLTAEPQDNDLGLTAEDLMPGVGRLHTPTRFLNYYSSHGIELALERYGYLSRFRALGFPHPTLELQLDHPAGQTLRIYGDEGKDDLLVELRLRIDRRTAPGREMLFVEWLLLQNPRAPFRPSRPPLPGQKHPGLGLLRETTGLLVMICHRLGLDGLMFMPSHFHLAAQSESYLRFLRPRDQGRFRALCRALEGLSLKEATCAVEEGRVEDRSRGETFEWQPAPMVLPVSEDFKAEIEGEEYERETAEAAARHDFSLRR